MNLDVEAPLNSGPGFEGIDLPRDEDLYRCVHCGLCLSACPTYVELNLETESPRGRIALDEGCERGPDGYQPAGGVPLESCLQCRACEAVCPSGVPFGRLMESTRAQVLQHRKESRTLKLVKFLFLRGALPHPTRLRTGARLLKMYRRWGFQSLVRKSRLLRLFPGDLAGLEAGFHPSRSHSSGRFPVYSRLKVRERWSWDFLRVCHAFGAGAYYGGDSARAH